VNRKHKQILLFQLIVKRHKNMDNLLSDFFFLNDLSIYYLKTNHTIISSFSMMKSLTFNLYQVINSYDTFGFECLDVLESLDVDRLTSDFTRTSFSCNILVAQELLCRLKRLSWNSPCVPVFLVDPASSLLCFSHAITSIVLGEAFYFLNYRLTFNHSVSTADLL
jgi:hypothetical protein